jgi:hypothetical protein
MRTPARASGKEAGNRPGGVAKWGKNTKKTLNRGNEPKNPLKLKELAFSGAKNELFLECNRDQSKRRIGPGIRELWGIE